MLSSESAADLPIVLHVVPLVLTSGAPEPETASEESIFTPCTLGRLTGAPIERGQPLD